MSHWRAAGERELPRRDLCPIADLLTLRYGYRGDTARH